MSDHRDLDLEKTLAESELLLRGAARSAGDDYEFTLEGILEEYGGKRAQEAADAPAGQPPRAPVPRELPADEEDEPDDAGEPAPQAEEDPAEGAAPQGLRLQEVLSQTVQGVLDEREPLLEEPRRRGLFSRRKMQDTEQLYEAPAPEPEPEEEPEPEPPEAPIEETVAAYREDALQTRRAARACAVVTLLMWIPPVLERFALLPELYAQEPLLHTLPFLVAELLVCVLGRDVFVFAAQQLRRGRFTYESLTALLAAAALTDGLLFWLLPARAAVAAQPFWGIGALAMTTALWGRTLLFRAMHETFRVAAVGDAPYMVTTTAGGAAKRDGASLGFSNAAQRDDLATRWQALLLPVILTAALVFAVLATVKTGAGAMFAWNLSALLAGADALAFPLVYALPLRRVVRRLSRCGAALAGWTGADAIRRSNCMILTDTDLFPPGTVALNGLKIFGEESGKVFSYAATMAHASESGLARLFDELLASEGGTPETLTDLNFYEEGGVGGTIHGETVLFGTSSFCRRIGVPLPRGITLRTGVFLAVDGALIAVFAVKYHAAENVDWALHALHRSRITPVLAVRDGNITPALLKRKFGTDARAVYPALSTRLALSEHDGAKPWALLYREGLMPYAEVAVGSKRLCRAVRSGTRLTLLSSVIGVLLAFYLAFVAAYTLLTPFGMLAFLLLWALASLVNGFLADRY